MDAFAEDWPYAAAFAFFFALAMARSNATYWAGRGLRAGGGRTRLARLLDGPGIARAESVVRRVGPVAVTLSFLTIGVQTAINAAAGVLRMPLRHYLPASALGSLAWAGIYTTIGFAVLTAWLRGDAGPWLLVAAVAVAVVVIATWLLRSRLRDRQST